MSAIPFLILGSEVWRLLTPQFPLHHWAYFALWISTILSLTSGWDYYQGYLKALALKYS
jgi:hypothetical protein